VDEWISKGESTMDNQIVAEVPQAVQHPHNNTNPTEKSDSEAERKIGIEIVSSADLSSRFFRGWGPASRSHRDGDLQARRLAEV
jgi:hypothetical protein